MFSDQIDRITKQLLSDDIKDGLLAIPENLIALRRLCHRPDTDIYDVELAVAKEPSFAAHILKLANSVLYGVGKPPCKNLVTVIQRIGMHSVSQYAFTYAIKHVHEQKFASADIASLIHSNWLFAWDGSQDAIQLYTKHRLTGCPSVKKVDISDILMLGILQHTGRLAVFSDFNLQHQSGFSYSKEEMSVRANQLNAQLLPLLFKHWGLPASYAQLFTHIPDSKQRLHAIDYLFAAALLKACSTDLQTENSHYNVLLDNFDQDTIIKVAQRLCYLQILSKEELNLDSIISRYS